MTAPDHVTKPFIKHLARMGASIHGFSWPLAFRCEDHADERWMDFLGFPRQNLDFQRVTSLEAENFSLTLFPWHSKRNNGGLWSRPCGRAGLFMERA
jgi:hypothetical protein